MDTDIENWFACNSLGEQLRDLLKKHGSFAAMELEVKKTHLKKKSRAKQGGYYTRVYLANHCHWTKCLATLYVIEPSGRQLSAAC